MRQSARGRAELSLLARHVATETTPDDFGRVDDAAILGAARSLGCSVGTVKSQTARGLATLRTTMQQRKQPCYDEEA